MDAIRPRYWGGPLSRLLAGWLAKTGRWLGRAAVTPIGQAALLLMSVAALVSAVNYTSAKMAEFNRLKRDRRNAHR